MDTQYIITQEQALLDAICQRDTAQLDVLLHEDLLFILPTGQTITKADDMATYRAGHLVVHQLHAREQQIRLVGAIAVVTVTIELAGSYLDQPFSGTYRYLRVWQQQNQGAWQVIAGSGMALPE